VSNNNNPQLPTFRTCFNTTAYVLLSLAILTPAIVIAVIIAMAFGAGIISAWAV
jgi:hypothetical protein